MKAIHFADVHIGVENYGKVDPETGENTRTLDILAALDEMVDYAIEEAVDVIIFAGDAFKSREPTPTQVNYFAQRIHKLAEHGKYVILLTGNHDLPFHATKAHALQMFRTLQVRNTQVADKIATFANRLQVVSVPWVNRSRMLTAEANAGKSHAEINAAITETVEALLDGALAKLHPGKPAIIVAHGSLSGATAGSERGMTLNAGADPVLPVELFDQPEVDYAALGHIHRHQVAGKRTPVVYSGSLQRVDFGEEGQEKGFCVLDWGKNDFHGWKFVPVKAREFVTVSMDLTTEAGMRLYEVAKRDSLMVKGLHEAVVRLKLRCNAGQPVDDAELRRLYAGSHYFAGIAKEVVGEVRPVLSATPDDWDPLTMLERFLSRSGKDAARQAELRKLAEGLLREDD